MDPHKIDPEDMHKLEAPERRERLPVDDVLDLLDPRPGTRCLDVGSGTGYVARPLARRVAPGRVVGLDRSHAMLAEARQRFDPTTGRLDGVQGLATRLPFRRASFARALSVNLHHEIDDVDAFLDELVRVLEQGALVLVVDWAPVDSPSGPPIDYRVPADDIAAQLEEAGFERVETHEAFAYHSAVTAKRSTRP